MLKETFEILDIKTINFLAINNIPPTNEENLHVELKRKIELVDDNVVCCIMVIVYKEAEENAEKKTFLLKYEVSATLNSSEKVESIESIEDDAVSIVFPYVRANFAALTSITCSSAITLPCLNN